MAKTPAELWIEYRYSINKQVVLYISKICKKEMLGHRITDKDIRNMFFITGSLKVINDYDTTLTDPDLENRFTYDEMHDFEQIINATCRSAWNFNYESLG